MVGLHELDCLRALYHTGIAAAVVAVVVGFVVVVVGFIVVVVVVAVVVVDLAAAAVIVAVVTDQLGIRMVKWLLSPTASSTAPVTETNYGCCCHCCCY